MKYIKCLNVFDTFLIKKYIIDKKISNEISQQNE